MFETADNPVRQTMVCARIVKLTDVKLRDAMPHEYGQDGVRPSAAVETGSGDRTLRPSPGGLECERDRGRFGALVHNELALFENAHPRGGLRRTVECHVRCGV